MRGYRRSLGSGGYNYAFGADPTTTAVAVPATPAPSAPSLRDTLNADPASTVAAVALVYHGYKRTGSIFWALVYGLAGKVFPIESVPIALAQGFGQKKECK
jgi:hypothetical protein